jgi:glucose/arabinose dehydrogenase
MRLGVWGWASVAALVVLALAAWTIRRPLLDGPFGGGPASGAEAPMGGTEVRLVPVASGFTQPVDLQFVPGNPGQAIVLEKGGRARLVQFPSEPAEGAASGQGQGTAATPGPDVVSLPVHTHSELGLLGLAFHPRYRETGLFYLNDNPKDSGPLRTRISEWHLPIDKLGKEPAQLKRVLLEIDQPYANHDGGQVAFGPDGYLYIGMGDGGSRADPQGNGQNLKALLGKMLRIDVDAQPGYRVPPDNPFVNTPEARPEIWAYGMRNPWRFSFDPRGRLIAADVGQDLYEEVSIVVAGDNQGWAVREATHCFSPAEGCETKGLIDPVFEYGRDLGNSITGGYVYLGSRIPSLKDQYVFGDFVSGNLWSLELPAERGKPGKGRLLGRFSHAFSAFGRDEHGELYALDFALGTILRLTPT